MKDIWRFKASDLCEVCNKFGDFSIEIQIFEGFSYVQAEYAKKFNLSYR